MKKIYISSKCVFCAPFCGHPACLLILVHRFLLPQGNGAPPHFVLTRQQSFCVLEGTWPAHLLEPQTFSAGARKNRGKQHDTLYFVKPNLIISISLEISLEKNNTEKRKNKSIHQGSKDRSSA